jgi:hypothetical protein
VPSIQYAKVYDVRSDAIVYLGSLSSRASVIEKYKGSPFLFFFLHSFLLHHQLGS